MEKSNTGAETAHDYLDIQNLELAKRVTKLEEAEQAKLEHFMANHKHQYNCAICGATPQTEAQGVAGEFEEVVRSHVNGIEGDGEITRAIVAAHLADKEKAVRAVIERVAAHKGHPGLSPAKSRDADNTIDYIVDDLTHQLEEDGSNAN